MIIDSSSSSSPSGSTSLQTSPSPSRTVTSPVSSARTPSSVRNDDQEFDSESSVDSADSAEDRQSKGISTLLSEPAENSAEKRGSSGATSNRQ